MKEGKRRSLYMKEGKKEGPHQITTQLINLFEDLQTHNKRSAQHDPKVGSPDSSVSGNQVERTYTTDISVNRGNSFFQ